MSPNRSGILILISYLYSSALNASVANLGAIKELLLQYEIAQSLDVGFCLHLAVYSYQQF